MNAIYFCITFGYNCDTKGRGKMTRFEQLEHMLAKHGGMLLTSQVMAEGISWYLCVSGWLGGCHVFDSSAL